MKRFIVGVLVFALMLLGPIAEAGDKRHSKHGSKTHAAKVAKAKVTKAKIVKAKSGKVRLAKVQDSKGKKSVKAGKTKKYAQASKAKRSAQAKQGKTGRKFVATKNQRHTARSSAAQHAGASSRIARYAPGPVEAVRADSLRFDYGDALTDGELELRSAAALVVDQKTGEALFAKNSDASAPIASITKLMTALVTLDAGLDLNYEIEIGLQDVDHLKGTSSRLPLGATLTRGELLNLALIASENRAAAALSRAYPGGREAFVVAMNRKAATLGMLNTHYVDGTGLSSSNRSTAADLARLVDAASHYSLVRQITSTGSYGVTVPGQRVVRIRERGKTRRVSVPVQRNLAFYNTNALTRTGQWDIGVSKTGYINEAGHCLVMQARIAERKVIIVLLDSLGKMSRIGDANRIRHWLENGANGRLASRRALPPV
jgi:D-alanyl-D-alanine endopeptidase (penicillin-binding protein 7)